VEKTRSFLVAIGVIGAVFITSAQDQTPPTRFRTDASYVRVDLYPTKDGVPVQDLTAADVEVLEENVPQGIEQFEHVGPRTPSLTPPGREPNTVAESRQAAQDPHARVFVIFLDPKHVELAASRTIGPPLVNALRRLISADDLVGVMVPGMSASDITFARGMTTLENMLTRDWWGTRDQSIFSDPAETGYGACYPGSPNAYGAPADDQGIAQAMILRRREVQTLDALEDMVLYLRGVREERKAVLAITDGWVLYRPDANLARPLVDTPQPNTIGRDPRSGRLSTGGARNGVDARYQACEHERQELATVDDEARLRRIMDEANRANTSFYPIDPRGLVAFDDNVVPMAGVAVGQLANPTLTPREESARLTARVASLRQLADATDGMAIASTNKIADGLRRITDDLNSYYLLGYYSTGKLDGRFHSITVRVRRPGVSVRARRGFQALRPSDLTASRSSARSPATAAASSSLPGRASATSSTEALAGAAASAVGGLADDVREAPFRARATAGWHTAPDGVATPRFWVTGEVADRVAGAALEAIVTTTSGQTVSSARGHIAPGSTGALLDVAPDAATPPGDYVISVRSQSAAGALTRSVSVTLPPQGQSTGAVFMRRGPVTANKDVPTADPRFRRTESLRVEVPSAAGTASGRLLDRTGRALAVPVTSGARVDADGTTWATGAVTLAPLAPGDYVVEITAGDAHTLCAFRLVP
jgi:VWFA-related protein